MVQKKLIVLSMSASAVLVFMALFAMPGLGALQSAEAATAPVAQSFTVYTSKDAYGKQSVVFYMKGKQNGNQWYDVIYAKIAGGPIYGSGAYQRDSGWYYYYTKDPNFVGKDIVKYQIVEKNTFRVLSNTATVTIISDGK